MLIAVAGDVFEVAFGQLEALGLSLTRLDQGLLSGSFGVLGYLAADARGFRRGGFGLFLGALKAALAFVQGKMAVTEDDGVGGRKALVQACQSAFGWAGVMNYPDGSPLDLDFKLGRQRAAQSLLVDVAVCSTEAAKKSSA